MDVNVIISRLSKDNRANHPFLTIVVTLDHLLNRPFIKKNMELYADSLKKNYFFDRVIAKEINSAYEFTCYYRYSQEEGDYHTHFIDYLINLGFVSITSLEKFEKMEHNRLLDMYKESLENIEKTQYKKVFSSIKVFMKHKDFVRDFYKLEVIRGRLESWKYANEESTIFDDKLKNADYLLTHIDHFYFSVVGGVLINRKVKQELLYFSKMYENMKQSETLIQD